MQPIESVMSLEAPLTDRSTAELLRAAIADTRALVEAEVELAKGELRDEIAHAKRLAVVFGVAAVAALLAASMLLVALALGISAGPGAALAIALVLVVVAAVLGALGVRATKRTHFDHTRDRLVRDAAVLKETVK